MDNQTTIYGMTFQEIAALKAAALDFIAQAEACNFTDDHGHPLANNAAYVALKGSVEG